MLIAELSLLTVSVAIILVSVLFFTEICAGLILRRPKLGPIDDAPAQSVILIPAHNEEKLVSKTIASIKSQIGDADRIIVVADNCTDKTADIARAAGAECLERFDKENRGKGFALQFGLDAVSSAPPSVVVFVDADCVLGEGCLSAVTSRAAHFGRPVQALYLMHAPENAPAKTRVSEFSWMLINKIRMSGLDRLFGVSRVTGSGIAIPWSCLEGVDLASGEIVEDLAMSFEFASRRTPVSMEPSAIVTSEFPVEDKALQTQSARWSIGSMKFAQKNAMTYMMKGITSGNAPLVALACDSLIPPVTILLAVQLVLLVFSGVFWLATGVAHAFYNSLFAAALTGGGIFIVWFMHGRTILPPTAFSGIIRFILTKFNVFGKSGRDSAKTWVATRSDNDEQK